MNIKKIVLALVLMISAGVSCFSQTDDQIRDAFQELIDALPSKIQKKQMEQNRDMVLNVKDPKARKQILDMLNVSVAQTEQIIEEQKNPRKKNPGTVKTEQLKNYKMDGNTIAQLSVTYRFNGLGTKESPFLISEPMELIIAGVVSNSMDDRFMDIYDENGDSIGPVNACYKLVKDLDFTKYPWDKPIGNVAYRDQFPFTGVLDGDGHAISNLTGYAPLVECIDVNGVVKNLIIKNANIKLDKRFNNGSPFCENNNGAIVSCSFDGSLEGVNNVYNIAYSKTKAGMAVCCFANNRKGKTSDFKDVKTFGCDKNLSDGQLNDVLSTWNALYVYNGDTSLNSFMHVESGKLVYGKTKDKSIPAKRLFGDSRMFKYAYSIQLSRNLFGSATKVYIDNLRLPEKTTLDMWTSDAKVKLQANGGSVSVGNTTVDTYSLSVNVKQADGSYKNIVLDDKNAYVGEAFDCGTVKGLTVFYDAGSSQITLLTEDAVKCLKEGVILPKTEDGMEMSFLCYSEYPGKIIVNKILLTGKW